MDNQGALVRAASILSEARSVLLFTGAGISVESGIPPFRGQGGLWEVYDPAFIEIGHFLRHPETSWAKIREIFYDHWGNAAPNPAHYALADLQKAGRAGLLVTQNIDCLHQRAGSPNVAEFHGTLEYLVCLECGDRFKAAPELTSQKLPSCPHCGGLLKPDVVFFGENIPEQASDDSFDAAAHADAVLVVGTSGEVMPACLVPRRAKERGAKVVEVNPDPSAFSRGGVTDVLLKGKAGTVVPELVKMILADRNE